MKAERRNKNTRLYLLTYEIHHLKELNMNTPLISSPKNRVHPMVIIASSAVVLVSLTATAALMGWLPDSTAKTTDTTIIPVQQEVAKAVPQKVAAPVVVYRQAKAEPKRQAPALVCQSCGTVESVREVAIAGTSNGVGAAGGAVVGGLLGNQVGGGHGKEAMTVVGAIGGALAGNHIEKRVKSTLSYETTVHMNNGSTRTIAQDTQPVWRQGDKVKLVDGVLRMNG
ncbi:MAG: glycine zipper 2TM domain-containing protein [Limisphaerales bacterium]